MNKFLRIHDGIAMTSLTKVQFGLGVRKNSLNQLKLILKFLSGEEVNVIKGMNTIKSPLFKVMFYKELKIS